MKRPRNTSKTREEFGILFEQQSNDSGAYVHHANILHTVGRGASLFYDMFGAATTTAVWNVFKSKKPTKPSAVLNLQLTERTGGAFNIEWQEPKDAGGMNLQSYRMRAIPTEDFQNTAVDMQRVVDYKDIHIP